MNNHIKQGARKLPFILVLILFALSIVLLTACSAKDIAKLEVLEESIQTNVRVSDFDITKITLKVTDADGIESTVAASANMLSAESKQAVKTAGTHQITLYYQKQSVTFEVRLFADDAELVTVTFKDKGGTVLRIVTTLKGESVAMIDSPAVSGLIKDGWADASGTVYTNASTIQKDVVLIAQYKESLAEYTVTFKDFKGNTIDTTKVPSGRKIPGVPAYTQPAEIANYKWYYGNNELNIDSLVVRSNIDITMKVEYVKYDVTFRFLNADGSYETLDTQKVQHGGAADAEQAISILSGKGYNFQKWDMTFANVRNELIITAEAALKTYTVTFKDFSGEVVSTKQVGHGKSLTEIPTSSTPQTGYNFGGWGDVNFSSITKNLEVHAVYVPKTIQVTTDVSGEEVIKQVTYGSVISFRDQTEGSELLATALDGTVTVLAQKADNILLSVYSDAMLTKEYNMPYKVELTQDIFIYTKWLDKTKGSDGISYSEATINDGIRQIHVTGYEGNDRLIYIPDMKNDARVVSISDNAFNGAAITSVRFGKFIETIGEGAFAESALAGTLTIPEGIKVIGGYAFNDCDDLLKVILPSTLESVGGYAFASMEKLAEALFAKESILSTLSEGLFADSESLAKVTLPGGINYISNAAFRSTGITAIDLENVYTVGMEAFLNTAKLSAVTNTATLRNIGERSFADSAIQNIDLPVVVRLDGYAFENATMLTSVRIGKYLEKLNSYVFKGCTALAEINFQAGTEDSVVKLPLSNIKIEDSLDAFSYEGADEKVSGLIAELNAGISTFAQTDYINNILSRIETGLFNRLDYVLVDWYADSNFENKLDLNAVAIGEIVLYAKVRSVTAPTFIFSFEDLSEEISAETVDAIIQAVTLTSGADELILHMDAGISYGRIIDSYGSLENLLGKIYDAYTEYFGYSGGVNWYTDAESSEELDVNIDYLTEYDGGAVINLYPSFSAEGTYKAKVRISNLDVFDVDVLTAEANDNACQAYLALVWGLDLANVSEGSLDDIYKAYFPLQGEYYTGLFTDEELTQVWDYDTTGTEDVSLYIGTQKPSNEKLVVELLVGEEETSVTFAEILIEDYYTANFFEVVLSFLYDIHYDGYLPTSEKVWLNGDEFALEELAYWPTEESTLTFKVSVVEAPKVTVDLSLIGLGGIYEHIDALGANKAEEMMILNWARQGMHLSVFSFENLVDTITDVLNFFHYNIDGWYTDSEYSDVFDLEADITEGVELFIKYSERGGAKVTVDFGGALDLDALTGTAMHSDSSLLYMLENAGVTAEFNGEQQLNMHLIAELVRKAIYFSGKTAAGLYLDAAKTQLVDLNAWPSEDTTIYLKLSEKAVGIGLQEISENAFIGSNSLKVINLPASVRIVEEKAFNDMSKLTAINVDIHNTYFQSLDGVLYKLQSLSASHTLELVSYPAGKAANAYTVAPITDKIQDYAFENANIATLVVPKSVAELGKIFESSFIKALWFEGKAEVTLSYKDFMNVYVYEEFISDYESIFNPDIIISIEEDTALPEMYDAHYGLFYVLSETATVIGSDKTRTSIIVPDSLGGKAVAQIGEYAFADNDALTEISIETTLAKIGAYAFRNNVKLTSVYVEALKKDAVGEVVELNAFEDTPWYKNSQLVIIADTALQYKPVADEKGNTPETVVVPSGVTVLTDGLFKDATIKSVSLPQTLEIIGAEVFRNTQLTSVSVPERVSFIGSYAFADCDSLTAADLSKVAAETLNEGAFENNIKLSDVKLPTHVKTIGNAVFNGNSNLVKITLPESLVKIGSEAFRGTGLITVEIPYRIGEGLAAEEFAIGENAFTDCEGLVYVRLYGERPSKIATSAFGAVTYFYVNSSTGYSVQNAYKNHESWNGYSARIREVRETPEFTFDLRRAEDGSVITDLKDLALAKVTSAVIYEAPAVPEVQGYIFMGWADSDWNYVEFPIAVTSNMTLFAKWKTAEDGTLADGLNVTMEFSTDHGGYVITDYRAVSGKLDTRVYIPATFKGYPIVAIGADAFRDTAVEQIIFAPDSQIKSIMANAFNGTQIKRVTLPEGLITIGESAFANNAKLEHVFIPSSVESVYSAAFNSCGSANIVFAASSKLINASVDSFAGSKWYNDAKQASAYVVAGHLLIEYDGTKAPNRAVATLPLGARAVAREVFKGNTDLISVEFHSEVYYIGESAFEDCENLLNVDFGPIDKSRVEYVGQNAFNNTMWLKNQDNMILIGNVLKKYVITSGQDAHVVLPDHITVIDNEAFAATDIKSIILPKNLKIIGENAFKACASLISVTIPAEVTQIGKSAFENCTALEAVRFAAGSKLQDIGERAFMGCIKLGSAADAVELVIPSSVMKIGKEAFKNATALKKVDLAQSQITVVNEGVFQNASALEEVSLSSIVASFAANAFNGCTLLEVFNVPEDAALATVDLTAVSSTKWYGRTPGADEDYILIHIGSILLSYKQKEGISGDRLKISVPSHIKYIADGAFKMASGAFIDEILLPEGLLEIGASAFENLIYLESVTIPSTVQKIGRDGFKGCSILKNVVLGSGLQEIGNSAFANCNSLKIINVNRQSYGALSDEQLREIDIAIQALVSNPDSFNEWYQLNKEVFVGTEIKSDSFPTTLTDMRIYVLNDSRNINSELYRSVWSALSSKIFHDGALPTVQFDNSEVGATQLAPVTTHLITQDMLNVNYAGHTLLGWQIKFEGNDYQDITVPYAVYRNATLKAKWLANDRVVESTLTDSALGFVYQYDTEAGGYYISRFDGINGDTLYIPATVAVSSNPTQKIKLVGIRPSVFTEINSAAIKHIVVVKNDNLIAFSTNVFSQMVNLQSFSALGSASLSVKDGVLYNKDMSSLIAYPAKKAEKAFAIHDGTSTILSGAFTKTNLEELSIPASVVGVKENAFSGNTNLASIVFAAGSEITEVGANSSANAFSGTKWFTDWSLDINKKFIAAGSYLLAYKGYEEVVTVPNTIKTIGNYAFYNKNFNNIEELQIPASVVRINLNAFTGSGGIKAMVFGEGSNLTEVANGVFDNTAWMNQQQEDNVEFVIAGKVLLKYNGSSMAVTVPSAVRVIGYKAFQNKELESITLHANIIRIDANAFYSAQNLKSMTIPAAVRSIGANAFYDNTALTSVTFGENSNLEQIGAFAFWNNVNLTAISIPDKVLKVGESAFENTTALKTLTIKETSKLTDLGIKAFKKSGITSVYIPNGLSEIKESTFEECTSLVSIRFSDSNAKLRKIGKAAFQKCTSLGSSLEGASTLITVTLPNRITVIEENAFSGCSGMYGIKLGEMVISIGENAFNGCYKLANITVSTAKAPEVSQNSFGDMTSGSYTAKRVYVNRSEDNSTINSYVNEWGGKVTVTEKILERGSTPRAIFVQMEGSTETVLYQIDKVEFLFNTGNNSNLPFHLSHPTYGQATSFYTDMMDPSGSTIATSSAPYFVLTENVTRLYVNWS